MGPFDDSVVEKGALAWSRGFYQLKQKSIQIFESHYLMVYKILQFPKMKSMMMLLYIVKKVTKLFLTFSLATMLV